MPHYIQQKAFTWLAASRFEQGQGFSVVPFKPAHEEWSGLAFVCILQGVKKGKWFFTHLTLQISRVSFYNDLFKKGVWPYLLKPTTVVPVTERFKFGEGAVSLKA